LSIDRRIRYEAAWSAIAEHLYAAEGDAPPTPADLIFAGQDAISRLAGDEMHHHGLAYGKDLPQVRPRFAAYWEWQRLRGADPATQVVERAALWQIWARLTDGERRALSALAVHGDHQSAADALGKTYGVFTTDLSRARARFLRLWHEGEKPSRVWGADRRVYRRGQAPVTARRLTVHDHLKGRKPRPVATPEPEHGASRYQNGHCRCPVCCEAIRVLRLEQARARGVQPRRTVGPDVRDQIFARRQQGIPARQVAAEFGVSEPLVYKIMRERRAVQTA
jgi:hypothetical protein